MSKKKLFILPVIVLVIVSVMSVCVFAGSASSDLFQVFKNNGSSAADDITSQFTGKAITSDPGFDLNSISGIQKKISEKDKKLKVKDFKFKTGADIDDAGATGVTPWRVYLTNYRVPKGYVAIMVHLDYQHDKIDYRVFKGDGKEPYIENITACSPFYLYIAKAKSSAQTGDFVPAYVAMIAVALMSCGAIFAIRAKKASK